MNIPLFRPNLGEEELDSLREIFKTGWVGLGPKTAQLEKEIADYQGVKYAVGTNSCTAALHLAVEALNLPDDAEVIVPTVTFVSTPHAVEYNRKKVVFCDVNEDDLCIDIADFESKITDKTKAVIPVHMGGQPAAMDKVMEVARRHNLVVIEDVANAQGGEWQGKKLGSWGDIGCLSFEVKKNMTTGDGGMILFNDEKYLDHIKRMRWVGMNKDTWKRFSEGGSAGANYSWYYEVDCLGFKYNMNDIAASLGLCQLKKLDAFNARKREIIKRYTAELAGVGDIHIPKYDTERGGYWLYIIHTDQRDRLFEYLQEQGITCGVHFMPTHLHPYYKERYPETSLPVAERVWKRIITLPIYYSMTEEEQGYVIEKVKEFYEKSA